MDLNYVKPDQVTREFLAVVLAGYGNDLNPLTSDHGDDPSPKALLPVANKPLLEYTLSWLEQSGIKDVLLICPARHRPSIHHHIHSDVSSTSLKIDLQTYEESIESHSGTCDILRQFSSRIPEDFVIVPCDFIPSPSLRLTDLLDKFRIESVTDGALATTCWFAAQPPEKGAFVEEWGIAPTARPIVWEPSTGTLLHIDTPDEYDNNSEEVELRMSMLSRYPRTRLSSAFEDSHVYVCRHAVLDLLHEKPHFVSLKEEFFPWLCKLQYSRTRRQKHARILKPIYDSTSESASLQHASLLDTTPQLKKQKDANGEVIEEPKTEEEKARDAVGLHTSLRVGVVLYKNADEPVTRINTLHKFQEVNRRMLASASYALPVDQKDRSLIDQRAQISTDSVVGESTQIAERTTIKRSVIGRHCVIGKMVKITGCVLLDHCVVEDGAKLEGCILGKNTQVGQKAELTRCVTQAGYEVAAGEVAKAEKLEVSDWMAGPDESESSDGDSDSD